MKKFLFCLIVFFIGLRLFGTDILTLNNQLIFEGKIKKINSCDVIFKTGGERYLVPAADIFTIEFGDVNDKVYTTYLEMLEGNPDACMRGQLDASCYHGKSVGHFILGVLLGPFAIIGTVASKPTPARGRHTFEMSKNQELFNDPAYLSCYKQKAKDILIGAEARGWGAWLLFLLLSLL